MMKKLKIFKFFRLIETLQLIFWGLTLLLPTYVFAVPTIYYFPANFDGNTQRPQEVSTQGAFPLICDGGTNGPRLAGLDLTRLYAGAASCPSNGSERFAQEVEYIFLVDDTSALSPYLISQFQAQNLLEAGRGDRQIVRSTVLQFEPRGDRSGFKILVVGEMAYRLGSFTSATWFAQLTNRFSSVVAGSSSGDDIAFMFHGSYYSSTLSEITNPSIDKIMAFSQKQIGSAALAAPSSVAATVSSAAASSAPTTGYITHCRSNDVPIPPIWNPTTGTNQWQKRGTLVNPFAASGLTNVEVWTFTSTTPAGICIALPRMDGSNINTNVQALGIICQSERTGKACFWDNVVRPTPDISSGQSVAARRVAGRAKITGASTRNLSPVRMSDGYNLEENCTDCHRGTNVFITRVGTALDVSSSSFGNLDSVPAVRYQPLSGTPADPRWANPVSAIHTRINGLNGQCMSCHDVSDNEIAQPTFAYCGTILENIIGTNMPVGDEANWRNYTPDVTELARECCRLGHNLKGLSSGTCPP
jgi:hypothetical protein